jgi:PST family polysaccharide transporter
MLNGPLAIWSFGDLKYRFAFIIFGLTIAFFGLNTTISSVLNGYRQIKYMIITGMIGSVISVFLALIITMKFGIMGALVNTAIGQICIFLINVQFIKHLKLFGFKMLRESFNKVLSWKLFKYAAMSLVSVLVVPTSTLIIRMYVFNNFSTNEAGFIQAVWGISSIYLMIITTALSVYYLPTLSGIKHDADLKKEIFNGYKLLLPLAILGGVAIYQCRDLIIFILYTPEFSPMKEYFLFQIIGDSFKIASWILGYLMVAKAMTSWFIATEIIFSGTYLVFSFAFMKYYGSVGVTYGYALNYLLYLTFMVFLFRKILFSHKSSKLND